VRNSPIYTTVSTYINSLIPLYYIFNHIYIKNSFNFNLILLNYLIKGILTFINPILFNFTLKATLLPYNWLITTYKLIFKLFAMLVSLYNVEIIIPNSIVTSTLSGILVKSFKL